jgi:hypothetical protein
MDTLKEGGLARAIFAEDDGEARVVLEPSLER